MSVYGQLSRCDRNPDSTRRQSARASGWCRCHISIGFAPGKSCCLSIRNPGRFERSLMCECRRVFCRTDWGSRNREQDHVHPSLRRRRADMAVGCRPRNRGPRLRIRSLRYGVAELRDDQWLVLRVAVAQQHRWGSIVDTFRGARLDASLSLLFPPKFLNEHGHEGLGRLRTPGWLCPHSQQRHERAVASVRGRDYPHAHKCRTAPPARRQGRCGQSGRTFSPGGVQAADPE